VRRSAAALVTICDSVTDSLTDSVTDSVDGLRCVGSLRCLPMADDPHEPSQFRFAFFADLNKLQNQFENDEALETALSKAVAAGFAFQSWVDEEGPLYCMAHHEGHLLTIRPSPKVYLSASQILAGLLGLPSSLGIEFPSDPQVSPATTPPACSALSAAPSDPAAPEPEPEPALVPAPAASRAPARPLSASESAAALVSRVASEFAALTVAPAPSAAPSAPEPEPEPEGFDLDEEPAAPDPQPDPSTSSEPISEEQKTGLLGMLRALPAAQSKAAIVAFRKAFDVPAGITKPGDAITEVRHLVFLSRFIDEAEGITAP
jgi:hypothetical protein